MVGSLVKADSLCARPACPVGFAESSVPARKRKLFLSGGFELLQWEYRNTSFHCLDPSISLEHLLELDWFVFVSNDVTLQYLIVVPQ